MTTWTAPDVASLRGDNSRPLQKIFGSLTEYLKHFETTIIDEVISQSSETFVRNGEATTLTIGTVVYLDAQQGDRATVKRAFNTSDATSAKTLGVVAETIAPNADGLVTTLGYVYKCDTSGYTAGQTLYLGSTAGTFTATKPVAPNHMVYVGVVVRANAGNGIIYVRCQNGYELDEIHDVLITSPTAGQILSYDAVSSLWKNTTLIDGSGLTNLNASNLASGTVPTGRMTGSYTGITGVGTLSALRVDGNFGIGVNGLAQIGLRIGKDISGSAFSQGIYAHGTIQPSVTSRSDTVWSNPSVAASVTLPALNHFYASSPAIGTGSTITTVTGYSAEANLGNNYSGTVTNVYAFSGNIASGTGRWNFFANGTANNYMAGRLGIGLAVTSGAMAQVVNTTAADKAFIIRGAASQSGDFFDIQNSGGASQFKVDSLGEVGIGAGSLTGYTLRVAKPLTGAVTVGSFVANGEIQSDVTSTAYNFQSFPSIVDAVFTLGTLNHFAAGQGIKGASATLTNQIGYLASSSLTGATNNYGFRGDIPTGANRWNLYMAGTAPNYMAGNTAIGATAADTGATLRISNSSDIVGIRIRAAAAQSGAGLIQVLDSSSNLLSGISPNGNFHIGTVPSTGSLFRVNKILTGQTNPNFIFCNSVIDSDYPSIAAGYGYWSQIGATSATSATIPNIFHNIVGQGTFTNTTVTNQHGYHVESSLTGATNNYGYVGNIPSGTGRWNLYMGGTANNYLAGNLGIGTTSPVAKLEVLGSNTVSSQTNVSGAFGTTTSGRLLLGSITGNTPFIGSEGATNLLFYTNATERMRITSAGNIGIGNGGGGDTTISIGKNITGATTAFSIRSLQAIQSDVTSAAYIFMSQPSTAAAAFTLANLVHFRAQSTTIGSTSAVANQYGFSAGANLTGATGFNIGFHGNIGAGTNRYNIYMDGTAQNYLAGNLGIGTATPSTALQVVGTVTATAFAGPLTGNVTGNVSGSAATVTGASQTAITSVGTLTGLTATGQVNLNRGSLGTTVGSSITFLNPNATTSNADSLLHTINRLSNTTTDWSSAVWKLQRYVDTTYMGFIQFGDGVGTGSVYSVQLGIGTTTYLKVSATATNVTGLLTTDNIWNASAGTSTLTGYQYVVRSTSGFPAYYYFTSMREGKRNIMSITDSGSLIDQLNPVTYQAKITDDDDELSASWKDRDLEYGFIAEEVAEVGTGFLAQYSDDGEGNLKPAGWKFHGVVSVLVAEVKDLRSRLKALEGAK